MWPTSIIRYTPLLPSTDRSPQAIKYTLVRRRNVLVVLLVLAVVIIVGTALTFDLRVAFASKRPDITSSPEISPHGSISSPAATAPTPSSHSPSNVSSSSLFKEHLSMEEITAMVSQTRGFYTRDYSLGLGWNNACPLIPFIFFCSYNPSRFVTLSRPLPCKLDS